jgi:hypothetical protein
MRDGNRRLKRYNPPRSNAYVFRVIREDDRVLLEPWPDDDTKINLEAGDEFITGTLNSSPWKKPHD